MNALPLLVSSDSIARVKGVTSKQLRFPHRSFNLAEMDKQLIEDKKSSNPGDVL